MWKRSSLLSKEAFKKVKRVNKTGFPELESANSPSAKAQIDISNAPSPILLNEFMIFLIATSGNR